MVRENKLETFRNLVGVGIASLSDPELAEDGPALDTWVDNFNCMWQSALIAGGTAPNKRGRSAPWWIRDCQNLWAKYRTARRAPGPRAGRTQEEKDYITGIRRAKADYWRRTIDEITDDKGLWDVVGWH